MEKGAYTTSHCCALWALGTTTFRISGLCRMLAFATTVFFLLTKSAVYSDGLYDICTIEIGARFWPLHGAELGSLINIGTIQDDCH